ncbi:MAG: fibronectin type III domain-containing protein, partial [Acidobacteriota bacterium]|nr:fibronectin type III domain-containing protein [Acidobacteriota bacterium]
THIPATGGGLSTAHALTLTGLSANTLYYYQVVTADALGNRAALVTRTFRTARDTTPPTISGVTSVGVTSNQATISWTTNEVATTQVNYWVTGSSSVRTSANSSLTTAHTMTIAGLTGGTAYSYQAVSKDAGGNTTTSATFTFTTIDNVPPTVSGVAVRSITSNQATIAWTTNEPATTQVDYWTAGNTTHIPATVGGLSTAHALTLTGLSANTLYYYQVVTADALGNRAALVTRTFRTTR